MCVNGVCALRWIGDLYKVYSCLSPNAYTPAINDTHTHTPFTGLLLTEISLFVHVFTQLV